jgi:peptidyl-Lys metalloendopeptidase
MNRTMKVSVFTASVLLAACSSGGADDSSPEGKPNRGPSVEAVDGELSVALSIPKSEVSAGEPASVQVTITNVGDHAVRVLLRDTPIEGINRPIFTVKRDGADVKYVGKIITFAPPQASDYLELGPAEAVTETVDLASAYDLSQTGNYTVSYALDKSARSVALRAEGRAFKPQLPSAPSLVDKDPAMGGVGSSRQALITGCSDDERGQIYRSWGSGRDITNDALDFLSQPVLSSPRFDTWFGTASDLRWSVVAGKFGAISEGFNNRDVECLSSCPAGWIAYVYSDSPPRIYICPPFWSMPQNDNDSQAGVWVHELSHFHGTDDFAYGQGACQNLAATDPPSARYNASNYMYFAENPGDLGYWW